MAGLNWVDNWTYLDEDFSQRKQPCGIQKDTRLIPYVNEFYLGVSTCPQSDKKPDRIHSKRQLDYIKVKMNNSKCIMSVTNTVLSKKRAGHLKINQEEYWVIFQTPLGSRSIAH